jgi:large subunit ribosomal protein L17
MRNLTLSLIKHEKIITTLPKAKRLRSITEKIVHEGKSKNLATRRKLLSWCHDPIVAKKVIEILSPRYMSKTGGFIRIIRKGTRRGDGAYTAVVMFINNEKEQKHHH